MVNLTQSQYFEIKIAGSLSSYRSKMFDGLELSELNSGETLIRGMYIDQAHLYGILILIRDMGIPLLSLNLLELKTKPEKESQK
jgi:hypothetical protein